MVQRNSKGEVADFQDENQFAPGKTAYACVAFSAALIYYAGLPNQGPTGTGTEISNLGYYWYGKEEGSSDASNTNGMSLAAEYNMLKGMGLKFTPLAATLPAIKAAIEQGTPVMLCGAETGMYDIELGDRIPYSWSPSGNHCIVVSGVRSDGNLLVHDCASIAPTGVRPGPRVYDASKLQLVSATAVHLREEDIQVEIAYNTPGVKEFFTETDPQHWTCLETGKIVQFAILQAYKSYGNEQLCGLTKLGLPLSNEIAVEHIQPPYNPTKYAHLAGNGIVVQAFQRGDLVYDPKHLLDSAPDMSGSVYPAHVNDGIGLDVLLAIGKVPMPEPTPPPQPTIQGIDPNHVKNFQQALELQAHDLVAKAQALESAIIVPVQ